MRRGGGAAALAVAALLLSACGDTGGDEGDAGVTELVTSREQVRAAAQEELPRLAQDLGAGVVWAEGRFDLDGDKEPRTVGYVAEAQLAAAAEVPQDDLATALEALGYDVTRSGSGTRGVRGERQDLVVLAVGGTGGDVRVTYEGPQLAVPADERPASEREPLDVPDELLVPDPWASEDASDG